MLQYTLSLPFLGLETLSNPLAMRCLPTQQLSQQLLAFDSLYKSLAGLGYFPRETAPQLLTTPLVKSPFYRTQELLSQNTTVSESEKPLKTPPSLSSDSSNGNYSKHCLKFCRKLSTTLLEHIKSKSNLFTSSINFCAEISKTIFRSYQLPEPNSAEFAALLTDFFADTWSKFKAQMSYSHNKGICIVKSEDWGCIFDKNIMIKNFQSFVDSLEIQESNKVLKEFGNCGLVDSLGRILYHCSMILVLTVILKDSDPKAKYLRTLDKIDNFLTLAITPAIYKNYNHRSAKFALECCGKCKVCCSKTISPDFEKELERARKKKDMIKSFIEVTIPNIRELTSDQVASLYGFTSSYL